jgi:uroporphyrinogen decarboxylase
MLTIREVKEPILKDWSDLKKFIPPYHLIEGRNISYINKSYEETDNFNVFYDAVGDNIDIMMMHKDMGNQKGCMISPGIAKEFFFPNFKRFVDNVKKRSKYYVMMHNCGSIFEFIPDLIECGIDILNPVQFTAYNMDPKKLKKEFGNDICFWGGGVDTQHILPFGTTEEVRIQVRENAKIFSEEGGFVFTPVHCIQAKVPAENIIAAFDEANKFM